MPRLDPNFLSEQECKEIATKQMLSFITLPDTEAEPSSHLRSVPRELLFPLDALPEGAFVDGPALLNWRSDDIYDVDGLLLLRDQTIDIGSGNEWRVRTAASDLLRTQVHCVYAGPAMNFEALKESALAELRNHPDLEPLIVDGEEDVRLVSYNYPNLGILCYSRTNPDAKFVIKLVDFTIIPVEPYEPQENPESLTAVWSPYDIVVRSTIAHLRWLWKRNMALLPALPKSRKDLPGAIRRATRDSMPKERITTPALDLIPQKTDVRCAAAAAQMILKQHGNEEKSQAEIAGEMQTGSDGATPEHQVDGLNRLVGRTLKATLDTDPSFVEAQIEILADRPFKTGDSIHARAVGGFRAEVGDKNWLYIYDPEPTNQGRVYCAAWNPDYHRNFMYVRPL